MMGRLRAATALAVVTAALAWAAGAASAAQAAGKPQWKVAIATAPTRFVTAANEVQEVTVTGSGGAWIMTASWYEAEGKDTKKAAFLVGDSASEVQTSAESTFGTGNVKVTGGPTESKPYRFTFQGELANTAVSVTAEGVAGAGAIANEVTRGRHSGELLISATNVGGEATTGPSVVSGTLPAGYTASTLEGEEVFHQAALGVGGHAEATCKIEGSTYICLFLSPIGVGDSIRVSARGDLEEGVSPGTTLEATAKAVGGGAEKETSTTAKIAVSEEAAPFGLEEGAMYIATSTDQAGAHPNMTVGFYVNQAEEDVAAGTVRNVVATLPAGLVGNPRAVPQCTMAKVKLEECPSDTALGVASVILGAGAPGDAQSATVLVYNIKPNPGEPAAFAFKATVPVRFDVKVLSNHEYAIESTIEELTQEEQIFATNLTLWGVPAQNNGSVATLSEEKVVNGPFVDNHGVPYGAKGGGEQIPFLTNSTRCEYGPKEEPAPGSIGTTSWPQYEEGKLVSFTGVPVPLALPAATGCERLHFEPQITVKATTDAAGTPAGYHIGIKVPQNEEAEELATPTVKDVSVTMPEGTVISPSAANGLQACSEAQFGLKSEATGSCPSASKIGTVEIATPLLEQHLTGSVYVGEPECEGPCTKEDAATGKMVRLFLEAELPIPAAARPTQAEREHPDVLVKLQGRTEINQATGRLTTVFEDTPQLPFSELTLALDEGEDAPLVNPASCGPAVATAHLTAWSVVKNAKGEVINPNSEAQLSASPIPISGCSAVGFSPALRAGMTETGRGGAFSPFSVTIVRPSGQQALGSVTIHTPEGLLGMLSKVQLCGEAQANLGACPAASQIGTTTAVVGPGSAPYTIGGGRVYLTEHYGGGPFGLSIVVPAQAGPYHLAGQLGEGAEEGDGNVVVRGSIHVDPQTAALTISTNPMPTQMDGIPLDIDKVIVNIDKQGFMFNPTNCNAMSITGTIDSSSGTAANVSSPFQANDCATLPFHPVFKASVGGHHSRRGGDHLRVTVESSAGQANIHRVRVKLPKVLPTRDETLKLACPEATFAANPASCDAGSVVGSATAHTPVLPVALTGPVYFVSHAGLKFPELVAVLQGDGVTVRLAGETFISKKGVTTSTFGTVPDVPVSKFVMVLPTGSKSAITGVGNLCKKPLYMPTKMVGQNGAVVQQRTRLTVVKCGHAARHHHKKHHHRHHHGRRHHHRRHHAKHRRGRHPHRRG